MIGCEILNENPTVKLFPSTEGVPLLVDIPAVVVGEETSEIFPVESITEQDKLPTVAPLAFRFEQDKLPQVAELVPHERVPEEVNAEHDKLPVVAELVPHEIVPVEV